MCVDNIFIVCLKENERNGIIFVCYVIHKIVIFSVRRSVSKQTKNLVLVVYKLQLYLCLYTQSIGHDRARHQNRKIIFIHGMDGYYTELRLYSFVVYIPDMLGYYSVP